MNNLSYSQKTIIPRRHNNSNWCNRREPIRNSHFFGNKKNTIYKWFNVFSLLLLSVSVLVSCKSRTVIVDDKKVHLDNKNAKELAQRLKENEFKYQWINAKFSTDANIDSSGNSFTVSMRARMDSIIWMSFSKLGIEGARALISRDSVKYIDRINSKYFLGDYSCINKILNADIDFEMLQALLIGNSVEFYDDDPRLKSGVDDHKYFLGTVRKRKMKRVIEKGKELKEPAQSIWMNPVTYKIGKLLYKDPNTNRSFEAVFTNFEKVDSSYFPMRLNYTIRAEKNITISAEYSKVSIGKPQAMPFNIPEGYEQIPCKTR